MRQKTDVRGMPVLGGRGHVLGPAVLDQTHAPARDVRGSVPEWLVRCRLTYQHTLPSLVSPAPPVPKKAGGGIEPIQL
jgi:hypothetical protein